MFKMITGLVSLVVFFIGLIVFMAHSLIRSSAKRKFLKVLEADLEKTTILQYRQMMKQYYSAFLSGNKTTKENEMQVAGIKRKFKVLVKQLDKTSQDSILKAMNQRSKLHRLRFINSLILTLMESENFKVSEAKQKMSV